MGTHVLYAAELVDVLNGSRLDKHGEQVFKKHCIERTQLESWDSVGAIYVIRGCRPVQPRDVTQLTKIDGSPVRPGTYPYALVKPIELSPAGAWFPDELLGNDSFVEGGAKQVMVNCYERDPKVRDACIAAHGLECSVCAMNFEQRYGPIGSGYIHVHHLTPLSSLKAASEVDPVSDVVPICANCHAMAHRRSPPYSIVELKKLISGN